MADTDQELKPCPFCGMPAHMGRYTGTKHTHYYVACSNNGCTVYPGTHAHRDKQALIEKWNTRADLAPALGLIPVSERLPSHLHSVLGFVINGPLVLDIDDGMFDIVSYSPDANVWLQNYGDMDAHVTVTHWMPLPDAPDTQEQSNE